METQSQEYISTKMLSPATDNPASRQQVDEKHSHGPDKQRGPEEDEEYVTGVKLILILISMVLVQFIMMLDASVISTAILRITNDFHSLLDVGWYGSAYQLASASLQPLTGRMYTYLRAKWTFFAFLSIFELGSSLCALAQSSKMLIVARAVAGLGASGLLNGGLTIVSACLPKHKRPAAMGLMISIGNLGQASGPLIGGAFTEYVTWRWCFWINLPIGGCVLALLSFIYISDDIAKPDLRTVLRTTVESLDLVGFVIFAPAAIMFFLALEYGGNQHAWNSATAIGLFRGAGAISIVFLCWEYYKGDGAMIPFSMVRRRIIWSSCLTLFFTVGTLICVAYYLPIYFQGVQDASPIKSGVNFLPNILLQITFAMVSGVLGKIIHTYRIEEIADKHIIQKLGYYLPWVLVGSASSAIGFGLLSMLTPTYSTAKRIGFQVIAGFGVGAAAVQPFIAIQSLVPQAQLSVAMATLVFCQTFGGATFLTIAETIFSQSLRNEVPKYAPGVNADEIIRLGATAFRNVVPASELSDVLRAYSRSFDHVFYLICATSVPAFFTAWGMGWKDVRKHKPKPQNPKTP